MSITIALADDLQTMVEQRAQEKMLTLEQTVTELLTQALDHDVELSIEQVVAKAKTLPHDSRNLRPARGSLADALKKIPPDPSFALSRWEHEWRLVETLIHANDPIG